MKEIINKANQYKHSSMRYIQEEDLYESNILVNNDSILIIGTIEKDTMKIDWATNNPILFIETMRPLEKDIVSNTNIKHLSIEFIPEEIIELFEQDNYVIKSEWMDYWKPTLEYNVIPHNLVIRPIEEKEYVIGSYITKSCKGFSRGYNGEEIEWFKEWKDNEFSEIFVAEQNNQIVGVCAVNLYGFDSEKGTVLWLREVAVHPEFHSQKIGLYLINHAFDWGVKNGAQRSFLACDRDNTKAIRLYEYLGYRSKHNRGQINIEKSINLFTHNNY